MEAVNRIEIRLAVFVFTAIYIASCAGEAWEWESEDLLSDGTMVCRAGALHYINCDRYSPGYHEVGILEDGALVGKLGALTYLIDSDGNPLSAGYHEIVPSDGGGYWAKVGAVVVKLDERGQVVSEETHEQLDCRPRQDARASNQKILASSIQCGISRWWC